MIFVTCIVSSDEWILFHNQASRSWPTEELSRAEIMRRLSLLGCDRVAKRTAAERSAMSEEFQKSLDPGSAPYKGRLPVGK